MIKSKQKIINSIESIEEVAILFYQQKTQVGYSKLQNTLGYIAEAIDCLYTLQNETGYNTNEMLMILNTAMASLERKDTILLSDILRYELKEELQKALMILQ